MPAACFSLRDCDSYNSNKLQSRAYELVTMPTRGVQPRPDECWLQGYGRLLGIAECADSSCYFLSGNSVSSSSACQATTSLRRMPSSTEVVITFVAHMNTTTTTEQVRTKVNGQDLVKGIQYVVETDSELSSSHVDIPSSCEVKPGPPRITYRHPPNSPEADSTGI